VPSKPESHRERFEADSGDRVAFQALEEQYFLAGAWDELVALYKRRLEALGEDEPSERARVVFRFGQALEEGFDALERAGACYREAVKLDPEFEPARRRLRQLRVSEGDWDDALALMEQEAERATAERRVTLLLEIGEHCLTSAGDPARAVEAFEGALRESPREATAFIGRARALAAAQLHQESVRAWEEAISSLTSNEQAEAYRSLLQYLRGREDGFEGCVDLCWRAHGERAGEAEWIETLAQLLAGRAQWDELAALTDERLARAPSPQARSAIAVEVGSLFAEHLNDSATARHWLARAAEWHESPELHVALADLATKEGEEPARASHLTRAMELGGELPDAVPAPMNDQRETADAPSTLAALRQRAEANPDDPRVLKAICEGLEARGQYRELVEWLERRVALAHDQPDERSNLLERIGELREYELGDLEGAADAYQMCFTLDPARVAIVAALRRVLGEPAQAPELIELLEQAAAAAAPEARTTLWTALGDTYLEVGDADEAVDAYRQALELVPNYEDALAGLRRAAAQCRDEANRIRAYETEASVADAARLAVIAPELVRLCRERDEIERALPTLRRFAQSAAGAGDALLLLADALADSGCTDELVLTLEELDSRLQGIPQARNRRRLGYLHAAEGRTELAIQAWRGALEIDAEDADAAQALIEAIREHERPGELLEVLDRFVAPQANAGGRFALLRARALEDVGELVAALAAYRDLWLGGSGDVEALAGYERVARAVDDADSLATVLEERERRETDETARDRLALERAVLLEAHLERAAEARQIYARLGGADGCSVAPEVARQAGDRLATLLEAAGEFAELCDHLERMADGERGAEACDVHVRLAELAEEKLGDLGRARRNLESAVAYRPDRAELWRRLAGCFDEATQPADLYRAVCGELDAPAPEDRRLELHAQAARLCATALADLEAAESHYHEVLKRETGHPEAIAFLVERCDETGDREGAQALLRRQLEQPADAGVVARLRFALADRLADRAETRGEAISLLETVRAEADAARPDLALVDRLAELYDTAGRRGEAAALCAYIADILEDPEIASGWWLRAARFHDASEDLDAATRDYERALEGAPDPESVRARLIELHRGRGETRRLVELLEAELAAGTAREAEHRAELAALYHHTLDEPSRALDHYEALVALEPSNARWRDPALALATRLELPDRVLPLLREAARFAPPSARGEVRLRLARLLENGLDRPDEAIFAYRDALRAAPDLDEARVALRLLLVEREQFADALTVLRDEVERTPVEAQLPLVEQAIELALEHLDRDALRPWLARLEVLADDEPELLIRLASLRARDADPLAQERALAAAARALDPERDRDRLCELHLERAQLLRGSGCDSRATAALERARELAPRHPGVLSELAELYHAAGRIRDLLEVFAVRLEHADAEERRELSASIAELCTYVLWEPSRAAPFWCELLQWDAVDLGRPPETLAPIRRVFESVCDWERWAGVAEAELRHARDRSSPAAIELRAGLVERYLHCLGRPRAALPHLTVLVDTGLASDWQAEALLKLLLREGRFAGWARRQAAQLASDPSDANAWLALAVVREQRLLDPAGTMVAYREAAQRLAEDDPSVEQAWSGLARVAERNASWPELDRALERLLALGAVPATPTWERLAEIRFRRCGDTAGARQAIERARVLDPDNVSALRLLRQVALAEACHEEVAALYRHEIRAVEATEAAALSLALARHERDRRGRHDAAADAFAAADAQRSLGAAELLEWAGCLEAAERRAAWTEVFARWCDHPDANSGASDHLALARGLAEVGRRGKALERLERALALEADSVAAWSLTAELCEAEGDAPQAGRAWRRVAALQTGSVAARALERCGRAVEAADRSEALAAFREARDNDPASAVAWAGISRLAEALDQREEASEAAQRLLATDADGAAPIDPAVRRDALAAGARSARDLQNWSRTDELASALLVDDAEEFDALWMRGRARFELGNLNESRRDLEQCVASAATLPESDRALFLELLGLCRKAAGQIEATVDPLREAIALAPQREPAQRALAEVLERLECYLEASEVFAEWASHSPPGRERAERFDRASQLRSRSEPGAEIAETWLRSAVEADPTYAPPRLALVDRLVDADRIDEAIAEAGAGAERLAERACVAELEMLRGRLYERKRENDAALDAYRRAAELNPTAIEAAQAAARLLRARGDWEGAAALLRNFCAVCPQDSRCSEAYLELGRLLAGPLEDIPGAVEAYRRARELAPGRDDVRESLADLLAQFPASSREATAEHVTLLRAQPLRIRSLRALIGIAERDGKRTSARRGMALLGALGVLSVYEREDGESHIEWRIGRQRPQLTELGAALQKGVQAASPFWAELLPEFEEPGERKQDVTPPLAALREAYLAAEAELLAPGWFALRGEALLEALRLVIRSGSDESAPEPLLQAGNRVRRRLRKAVGDFDLAVLEEFDAARWQQALAIQALAVAVDASGGDLRSGLQFALAAQNEGASLRYEADVDLTPWVPESAAAVGLYERALNLWLDAL